MTTTDDGKRIEGGQEGRIINVNGMKKRTNTSTIQEGTKPFAHAFLRMTIIPSEWAEKIASTRISFSGRYLLWFEDKELIPRVPLPLDLLFLPLRLM